MSRSVNLPNVITTLRVILAPLVAALLLQPRASARLVAFIVYLVAAISDLVDGALRVERLLMNNPRPIGADDIRGIFLRALR